MALLYADGLQRQNTSFNQCPSDSLIPEIGMDRKVVEVSPPAVMSAENRCDDHIFVSGHKAHGRITSVSYTHLTLPTTPYV
jgi:hypothetical protein